MWKILVWNLGRQLPQQNRSNKVNPLKSGLAAGQALIYKVVLWPQRPAGTAEWGSRVLSWQRTGPYGSDQWASSVLSLAFEKMFQKMLDLSFPYFSSLHQVNWSERLRFGEGAGKGCSSFIWMHLHVNSCVNTKDAPRPPRQSTPCCFHMAYFDCSQSNMELFLIFSQLALCLCPVLD